MAPKKGVASALLPSDRHVPSAITPDSTGTGANSAMLGQVNQRVATAELMIGVQMLTMAIAITTPMRQMWPWRRAAA
jgi:hypothetical protein